MITNPPDQRVRLDPDQRWRARPWTSRLVRLLSFLIPIVAAVVTGLAIIRILPAPTTGAGVAGWWVALILGTILATKVFDRVGRRLLPLAWLLRMTFAFPDKTPSRMRVALAGGTAQELRERLRKARAEGDDDGVEVAGTILALARAINNHDGTTRAHSERVQACADLIAEQLGYAERDRDRLRWAALLHDVGKLAVPAEILTKEGSPTEEEWAVIRTHPRAGMEIAAPLVPWLGSWAQTIEHHHEQYDGSGYPFGLAGEEIAIGARIVAVADAFDTITSFRSYKKPLSADTARRELATRAGTHFDPRVVRALFNVSLGRLRWVIGPASWLAQVPLIGGIERLGRDAAVLSAALLAFLALFLGGVVVAPQAGGDGSAPAVEADAASSAPLGDGTGGMESPAPPLDESQPAEGSDPASDQADLPAAPVVPGATTTTIPEAVAVVPPITTTRPAVAPNRDPVFATRALSVDEDRTVGWVPEATDPDGDPISCFVLIGPGHGSASVARDCSSASYTPDADYSGPDTLTILASDGAGFTRALVTLSVIPVEDGPVTAADVTTTPAGAGVHIDVAANDRDAEGGRLTVVAVSAPGHGSAVVNTSGTVTYTPAAGFAGIDSFSYEVCDPAGICATGVVTVTVP